MLAADEIKRKPNGFKVWLIFTASLVVSMVAGLPFWKLVADGLYKKVSLLKLDSSETEVLNHNLKGFLEAVSRSSNIIMVVSVLVFAFALFLRFDLSKRVLFSVIGVPIAYCALLIGAVSFAGNSLIANLLNKMDRLPKNMSSTGMNDRVQNGLEFYLMPNFVMDFALFTAVILILMGFRDRTFRSVLETKLGQVRKK